MGCKPCRILNVIEFVRCICDCAGVSSTCSESSPNIESSSCTGLCCCFSCSEVGLRWVGGGGKSNLSEVRMKRRWSESDPLNILSTSLSSSRCELTKSRFNGFGHFFYRNMTQYTVYNLVCAISVQILGSIYVQGFENDKH